MTKARATKPHPVTIFWSGVRSILHLSKNRKKRKLTYSTHVHTVHMYTQYTVHIYTVHMYTQYISTHSIQVHTVHMYTQYTCTHSTHAHTVQMYRQYKCTHSTPVNTVLGTHVHKYILCSYSVSQHSWCCKIIQEILV
jgi:hypothetical protein